MLASALLALVVMLPPSAVAAPQADPKIDDQGAPNTGNGPRASRSLDMPKLATAKLPPHPAQVPAFTFSDKRPRLVVLMHGVSPKHSEDAIVGIANHARYYWGIGFIQGILGSIGEPVVRVLTPHLDGNLHLRSTRVDEWDDTTFSAQGNELAPIAYPVSFVTDARTDIETNTKEIKNFIRIISKPKADPMTAVMVTFREGSKHLMPQTADAIDQIYASYILAYGDFPEDQQPQIYLVGHSFGGIVARTILAVPTGPDLFGNKLTDEQRWRADYIRKRTVLITTLASPHHPTPMGQVAPDFSRLASAGTNGLITAAKQSSIIKALGLKDDLIKTLAEVKKKALDGISGTRDCLEDLLRIDEYNAGILKPDTATRGNGQKVPIYTIAGRNPSGLFFDKERSPILVGGVDRAYSILDLIAGPDADIMKDEKLKATRQLALDQRQMFEGLALYLISGVMHHMGYGKAVKSPWGKAPIPEADMVRSPWAGVGPARLRTKSDPLVLDSNLVGTVLDGLIHAKPYTIGSDGDTDSDGFLAWDAAHGLGIPGDHWYRLYDHAKYGTWMPWDQDNHGNIMFNPGTGMYLHNEMLGKAGPNVVAGSRLSRYEKQAAAPIESHEVKVEVLEIHDPGNGTDGTGAEYQLTVSIADLNNTQKGPNNTQTWKGAKAVTHKNIPSSVVPIRIRVTELDNPPGDPNDDTQISGHWGREDLYVYFDTRTGKLSGDVVVTEPGAVFSTKGYFPKNRLALKIRITGK